MKRRLEREDRGGILKGASDIRIGVQGRRAIIIPDGTLASIVVHRGNN